MKKKRLIWGASLLAGLVSTSVVDVNVGFAQTAEAYVDFSGFQGFLAGEMPFIKVRTEAATGSPVAPIAVGSYDDMSRAEFAQVAAVIYDLEVDKDLKTSSFSDVKSDDPANGYALPYIEAVKKAGITDGTGSGQFDPAGTVTKEQLATFLVRGLGMKEEATTVKPEVPDDTVSDWAKDYVALALELNLLKNEADGTFGGHINSTQEVVIAGAYEAKKEFVQNNPLQVTHIEFAEGNKLNLTLTAAVDEKSVDLYKITVNGVPLDPQKERYELSEDGKTLVITLNDTFTLDDSKTPDIKVEGLKTPFGNEVKQEANKSLVVVVQTPPKAGAQKPTPTPVPARTNPAPITPVTPNPSTPTVPTNPEPSTPTVPTTPEPSIPTVPTTPEPSTPTDPTTPEPSIPTVPTTPEPSIPTVPTNPEPSIPSDPTDPDPSIPTDPTNPDPSTPTDPTNPYPSIPTDPTNPYPSTPSNPSNPDPSNPEPSIPYPSNPNDPDLIEP